MSLIIKNGKISRDGIIEKPEIGNIEHIKLLRKYEKYYNSLIKGLKVDVSVQAKYEGSIWFRCICGKNRSISSDMDDEDDLSGFNSLEENCSCGIKYRIVEKNNSLYLKKI